MTAASEVGTFAEREDAMEALARPLTGRGIEIGPADKPYVQIPDSCQVTYLDRWPVWHSRLMFPELRWGAPWQKPDGLVDVDREGLSKIADGSQDFVIASHIVEHLANPLKLLAESYRVLRTGGLLVLLAPNRHRTFDEGRTPTPLAHVVDEYKRDVSTVDDDHLREFLTHTGELKRGRGQRRQLRHHRRRSVHAHCWNEPEFFEILDYLVRREGHAWAMEDFFAPHAYPGCHEFGYLLRKVDPAGAGEAGGAAGLADRMAEARERLIAVAAR